jgi:hypothetical protein
MPNVLVRIGVEEVGVKDGTCYHINMLESCEFGVFS